MALWAANFCSILGRINDLIACKTHASFLSPHCRLFLSHANTEIMTQSVYLWTKMDNWTFSHQNNNAGGHVGVTEVSMADMLLLSLWIFTLLQWSSSCKLLHGADTQNKCLHVNS